MKKKSMVENLVTLSLYNVQTGCIGAVLRIRDVLSRIREFFHPGFRISDPTSNVKRGSKNLHTFFLLLTVSVVPVRYVLRTEKSQL
jgi:hypothetical protein